MKQQHGIFAIALIVGLQGCAAATAREDAPSTSPQAVTKDSVTVENLLRWSLEGEIGLDKVLAGLRQVIEVQQLQNPGQFSGRVPTSLADGYRLSFASFTPETHRISIGIESAPCFPTDRVAAMTGASASSGTRDVHGADIGRSFDIVRYGFRVSVTTDPSPYRCVDSIHIRKEILK